MTSDFDDDEFVTEDYNDFDIIIIGAGLTGLTCAYNILKRKAGLDVLIIEANEEIGGRIRKEYSETFHANSFQYRVTDLLKTLHIKTDRGHDTDTKKRILYTKHGPSRNLPRYHGPEVYNFLQTIEENASDSRFSSYTNHEEAKRLAETSVEQLLHRVIHLPYTRTLCRSFICSTCATRNLDDVSALWLLVMLNGASGIFNRLKITIGNSNRYYVQGGMTKIVQELFKKIQQQNGKIKLVERVKEIRFNDRRAYVFTEKYCLKCEYVVVAVAPSMHDDIVIESPSEHSFDPRSLYAPGKNVFFKVIYKTSPWITAYVKDIITTWDTSTNLNIVYNATQGDSGQPVLAGFLAESNATQTHRKELFDTLNECFETTQALNYVKYEEWSPISNVRRVDSNPMSVMKPTSISNHINYIGTPDDRYTILFEVFFLGQILNFMRAMYPRFARIFFASSEYAVNWPGTVDGAIEAGEDTAYSILSRIRPQALTFHEISSFTSKSRTRIPGAPFEMCAIQYFGLILNVAVFLSFLKSAYTNR